MTNEDDLQNISTRQAEDERLKEEEARRKKLAEEQKKTSALNVDVTDFGNSFYSDDNFKIMCHRNRNGSYSGITTDGRRLHGKNFEEMNNQACLLLKQRAQEKGKEATVRYNGTPRNERKAEIFCRNAIVKFGMTIRPESDMPQDKNFWKELYSSYLENGGKSEDWARITRFVPDNVMGRTSEEAEKNAALIDRLKMVGDNKFSKIKTISSPVRQQNFSENAQYIMLTRNKRLHT